MMRSTSPVLKPSVNSLAMWRSFSISSASDSMDGMVYSRKPQMMNTLGFSSNGAPLRNVTNSLRFRGVDHHSTLFTQANALGANAGHFLQRQMHDAPLARRHGVKPERLVRALYAFCRDARRHAQLFKAQGAIAAAVQMNFFVVRRFEAQRAKREMLERL